MNKKDVFKVSDMSIAYKPKKKSLIKIDCSETAVRCMRSLWTEMSVRETVRAFYLNASNEVIGCYTVGIGSLAQSTIDIQGIFQAALLCAAKGIILAHNHPSGSVFPSRADEDLTRSVRAACTLLGFTLSDHIILTEDNFYSMADADRNFYRPLKLRIG